MKCLVIMDINGLESDMRCVKLKVLWAGPFLSDNALLTKLATKPSEARWSSGLLRGLSDNGCEIRVISHCPEQRWPKGRVFWQNNAQKWFRDAFPCERIGYLNVWGIKGHWLDWAYTRAAKKIFREWRPEVVLCYNSLHSFNVAVMREAHKRGIKCVPIILDGDDPRRDNWKKLLRDNRFADGVVFLSWWMYKNYPRQDMPLLHMDGGAEAFKGDPSPMTNDHPLETRQYTLVHTGALDYWRGLEFMKGVVHACKRQDVRFVFCGKCDRAKMWAEFGNDSRVEVKGFLSNEEMAAICQSADILLSVREPKVGDNVVNYPSKIPNYLAWGKPIVSTWVPSLSSEYRDILEIPADDTPEAFARKIDEVLVWDGEKKCDKFNQIKAWFEARKSWVKQSERLVEFIRSIAG